MSSKNKKFEFDIQSLMLELGQWEKDNIKAYPKHEEQIKVTRAAMVDFFVGHEGVLEAPPEVLALSSYQTHEVAEIVPVAPPVLNGYIIQIHRFQKDTEIKEIEATDQYHAEDKAKEAIGDIGMGDWYEVIEKPEDQIGLDFSFMDNE